MFHSKQPNPTQHFPYEYDFPLPQQVKQPVRGGRWVLEIIAAGIVVVLLLVGGVLIYNHIHTENAPAPSTSTNVQQAPQSNQSKKPTNAPATDAQSGKTNSGTVYQPSGQ